ncbi:MAG: hypothetical protein A3F82_06130 [Deltaproteobacteria bacterium RIFCSPLOWO2_12_FULL_44_12]|nr:MAG: hypothetical protein A2712_01175 [Deltaproteobacteria bacterium RIFCSPHIGHO2_01_FULL_43_49]OGQ15253.1 MAG: hypothetical protein A3D22_04300 [Deltaproteobacteria bacterium RIFCSPHIGHO2_02_FULL_44_53]OGQ27124.1 MAG: hypothetical protein A3D98_01765 [Deltaproteobacteria bacterium RIFCSPHIGHO2_12_FULL_44_21]OGQ31769.1 MAG: hypothetical protein A2979_05460 [Deltaproteobacteria bacterium RIFCSPLOWO2_01_FULL_45_74]OGQ42970.1 MAG: hypothetical protein A3I70_07765 [Deltaproteobacteria bacterium 
MFSTIDKIETLRTAKAQAILKLTPQLVDVLESRKGPKGDAYEIARAAGILAAKRTWEIIPYCHPIPIDHIAIDFLTDTTEVKITTTVSAVWKTGVEMEALMAAQVAAITLFDMLKPMGAEMEITSVKVLEKMGGKTSFKEKIPQDFKVGILVTSDGTFAGQREDRSGKIIKERLEQFGIKNLDYQILPDDKQTIREKILKWCVEGYHLILTTGGTGLGPRDVTSEATQEIIEREIPGIMEAARSFGQDRTPYAMLSRGVAGLKGKALIVNLPGSSQGTKESLDAIFPAILHSYKMMAGEGHGENPKSEIRNPKLEKK